MTKNAAATDYHHNQHVLASLRGKGRDLCTYNVKELDNKKQIITLFRLKYSGYILLP